MSGNPNFNFNARFINISNEEFVVKWNGKERKFDAGSSTLMPGWFAHHCALHLTNKMLLTSGNDKDENYTSPKHPEEVPRFMHFYKQCFKPEGTPEQAAKRDELDAAIEGLNPSRAEPEQLKAEKKEEPMAQQPQPEADGFEGEKPNEKDNGSPAKARTSKKAA